MKKIKYMYIVYAYRGYQYESVEIPFADWIYSQHDSKDTGIIYKFWVNLRLDYCNCYFSSCSEMLWDIYFENQNDKKILYF